MVDTEVNKLTEEDKMIMRVVVKVGDKMLVTVVDKVVVKVVVRVVVIVVKTVFI